MNIEKIIEVIKEVSEEKYPGDMGVADFCQKIIRYERDNTSYAQPRYKEPYRKFLNECIRLEEKQQ